MLGTVQSLCAAWDAIPSVVTGGTASVHLAVEAWQNLCPNQRSLDDFVWNVFKQRYGDQDKISTQASTVASPGKIANEGLNDALDVWLDGFRSSTSVKVLCWEPALISLLRVTKSPAANPVIRKQCYKFVFDWIRAVLALAGSVESAGNFIPSPDNEPVPVCTCAGFPSSDPLLPCVIHVTEYDDDAVTSTAEKGWKPVRFRWIVACFCSALTDVWSAIRKDASTRLFAVIDLLPMQHVHRIVASLVRIIGTRDKREGLWREHEGALLGLAIVLKRFRRAGAREVEEPTSPSAFRMCAPRSIASTTPITTVSVSSLEHQSHVIVSAQSTGMRSSPLTPNLKLSLEGGSQTVSITRAHTMKFTPQSTPSGSTPLSPPDSNGRRVVLSKEDLMISVGEVEQPNSPFRSGFEPGSPRSPRWDRRVRSESDKAARASPRHRSLVREPSGRSSSRFLYRSANLTPRAARLLEAVMLHPSTCVVGVDRGLWFGGKLLAGLPSFISLWMRSVAYPMLAHTQLSVRENSIRLYATYLSRSPVSELVSCLDDLLDVLALKTQLSSFALPMPKTDGDSDESSVPHASSTRPLSSTGLLSAFSAEGVLGLLAIVVRLVGVAGLVAEWPTLFQTLFAYLGHPASTVRQITSKVFMEILVSTKSDESDESFALMSALVSDLVSQWQAPRLDVDPNSVVVVVTDDDSDVLTSTDPLISSTQQQQQQQQQQLSWECKEGLLLTYELILNFVLAAHRRKLHPYASLTAVKQKSLSALMLKKESMRIMSPEPKGANGLKATPVKGDRGVSDALFISPMMSPWISSPPNGQFVFGTPMSKPKPPLHPEGVSTGTPSMKRSQSIAAPSFLERLCSCVGTIGDEKDGRVSVWWSMCMQLVDALSDGGFELRRMADQVLPLLTETLLWADLNALDKLWSAMTTCASLRLTPACMVIGRTLSLCVRRMVRLQLNLQATGAVTTVPSRDGTRKDAVWTTPETCTMCGKALNGTDTGPLFPALERGTGVDVCSCVEGTVVRATTHVRALFMRHLSPMMSLCLSAPSDAVLVLMCETLVLVREYLAQFPECCGDISSAASDSGYHNELLLNTSQSTEDDHITSHASSAQAPINRLLRVVLNRVFMVIGIFDKAGLPPAVANHLSPRYAPRSLEKAGSPGSVHKHTPINTATPTDAEAKQLDSPLLSPVYSRRVLSYLKSSGCFTPRPFGSSAVTSPAKSITEQQQQGLESGMASPRTSRVSRAQVLDSSLAASLTPLFLPLLQHLTPRETMSLLPLVSYWGVNHADPNVRLGNLDTTDACLDALLRLPDVKSVCLLRLTTTTPTISTSSSSTNGSSGLRGHRGRPSPLSQVVGNLEPLFEGDSPPSTTIVCDNVSALGSDVIEHVLATCSMLTTTFNKHLHDVSQFRACLVPLKTLLIQSLLLPAFQEVLTAIANSFRAHTLSLPSESPPRWQRAVSHVDAPFDRWDSGSRSNYGMIERTASGTFKSAPVTPTRVKGSASENNPIVMQFTSPVSVGNNGHVSGHVREASYGSTSGGEGGDDVKPVSPIPVPDPKLWRGPMLDTSAARVSRTSSRLIGLSVDFTAEGIIPVDDGRQSPQQQQTQLASARSSERIKKQKSRDPTPNDVVTVSETNIDEVLLTVDVRTHNAGSDESRHHYHHTTTVNGAVSVTDTKSVAFVVPPPTTPPKRRELGEEVLDIGTPTVNDKVGTDVASSPTHSDAGSGTGTSSESGCDWDDWDAESDNDTAGGNTNNNNNTTSSFEPVIAEVAQFLRGVRLESQSHVTDIASGTESPFDTVLQKQLVPTDAFVIHWLLRQSFSTSSK